MRCFALFIVMSFFFNTTNLSGQEPKVKILHNHIGYETLGAKHGVILSREKDRITAFRIMDYATGQEVFSGKPEKAGAVDKWRDWGDWVEPGPGRGGVGAWLGKWRGVSVVDYARVGRRLEGQGEWKVASDLVRGMGKPFFPWGGRGFQPPVFPVPINCLFIRCGLCVWTVQPCQCLSVLQKSHIVRVCRIALLQPAIASRPAPTSKSH